MANALKDELKRYRHVCLIGSDCLDLTATDLDQAMKQLSTHDLVLGPAKDGGYYLIGMKRFIPQLFTDIPWGSDTVLAKTLARAAEINLKTALLNERTDVDHLSDLPANWMDL